MTIDSRNSILVTGATGFVGRALCRRLVEEGRSVVCVSRRAGTVSGLNAEKIESLGDVPAGHPLFANVDAVVHLAGHAHAPGMNAGEQECVFASDAAMTARFAKAAAQSGVRRFVFVSTAKVFGETSGRGESFTHSSVPAPQEPYARYKLKAEDGVRDCAEANGMEWVVVRPVLVYGSGVKGNLATLLAWIARGQPLPLAGIGNQRSLLALDDLVDLLRICISSPATHGQRLAAAGDDTLSTEDICHALADGAGCPARLLRLPDRVWRILHALPYTAGKVDRLTGSFVVDNHRTRELTDWAPRSATYDGLVEMARDWKDSWR